jgi:hypothetical protein
MGNAVAWRLEALSQIADEPALRKELAEISRDLLAIPQTGNGDDAYWHQVIRQAQNPVFRRAAERLRALHELLTRPQP